MADLGAIAVCYDLVREISGRTVRGNVLGADGMPTPAEVILRPVSSDGVGSITTPNALDGSYIAVSPITNGQQPVTLICRFPGTDENALVYDNIIPL